MSILTEAQRHHWHSNGWLLLTECLIPQVVQALSAWVDDIATEPAADAHRLHYYERTTGGTALCRTERFVEDYPHQQTLIVDGILPMIAGALLDDRAILYKEKINYKLAGGAGFAPHQDAAAYRDVSHHITCLVAVDAMTAANGCLEFAPGHAQGMLSLDDAGCITPRIAASLTWTPVYVPAGGVLFFSSYTPHRSGPNQTAVSRRAMYLTYNAASEGDLRAAYYQHREQQLAAHEETAEADTTARISTIGHFLGHRVR